VNLVACDGTWQQSPTGEILCNGTLRIVVGGGPFGLPPLTYTDANLMLLAVAGLWCSIWVFRQAARLFS